MRRFGTAIILFGGILVLLFGGCSKKTYHVEGSDAFSGLKQSYRAGEQVEAYFRWIATDTDYTFYLDDTVINPDYEEDKGFVLRFDMPARDVTLRVEGRNTMEYQPEIDTEGASLRFDSFEGGGYEYLAETDDPSVVALDTSREYAAGDPGLYTDGASYTWVLTVYGLKSGTARVTVTGESGLMDPVKRVYLAEVDDALNVTLTQIKENTEETP